MSLRSLAVVPLMLALAPVAFGQTAVQPPPQYQLTDLVSNVGGGAAVTDPNLVNPWGVSRSSGGPWWVSDNGTGLSTLYSGVGAVQGLVVTIPPADPAVNKTGSPTGTIFNGTPNFTLAPGKPAIFLFATEDGTISGWNPGVAPTTAVIAVNEKTKSVFKGLTMAKACVGTTCANLLYAADFRQARVAVYDTNFQHMQSIEQAFAQVGIPAGYAPFNVQNLGGNLYVTLAKQDAAKFNEVDGTGLGFLLVISPTGELLQRFQPGPWFNAPWGVAIASSDFGAYSHDVLVGNFGSGEIQVFDPITGRRKDVLKDAHNAVIKIDGLWGLSFGNSTDNGGPATTLYFAAGLHNEQDGLFGSITALQNPQGNDQ